MPLMCSISLHHSDLHVAEPGGRSAVAGVADLAGLALAAVRRAPHDPVRFRAHRVAAAPELGRNARVGGIAEHRAALPVLDLPAELRAELEAEALVVDRPRAVR